MRKVLYREIQVILEKRIVSGQYPLQTFLPSEKKLAEEFGVSLITIRRAIENLAAEGYVKKRIAKGAQVVSLVPLSTVAQMSQFSTLLKERGEQLSKLPGSLKIIEDDGHLGFSEQKEVYQFTRSYLLNEVPFILETHYFPKHVGQKIVFESLSATDSLYHVIYNAGFKFYQLNDQFQAIFLTETMRKQLKTDATVGLLRVRNGYDKRGKKIHRLESIYNTVISPYLVEYAV